VTKYGVSAQSAPPERRVEHLPQQKNRRGFFIPLDADASATHDAGVDYEWPMA
jgi:hypothetical protein